MIKLVYCLHKRSDLGTEEFRRYWLEEHAPLVQRCAQAIRARKYVQSHTVAPELNEMFRQSRGLEPAYDGVTEVWWDDLDALKAGMRTEEGRAAHRALLEDEGRFIDLKQSRVFMTEEHVIF
jgi:uncharacterized protein (TIGR02118 family)